MLRLLSVAALLMSMTARADVISLPVKQMIPVSQSSSHSIEFQLKEGDYLRGNLSGSLPVKAWLTQADGTPVRYLTRPGDIDARVAFLAPETATYKLMLQAEADSVNVRLMLEQAPLLKQGQSQKSEITSAAIQKAAQSLAQGKSEDQVWSALVKEGTPLVENPTQVPEAALAKDEQLVTFLWKGAKDRVLILGAPGYEHDAMHRLGETDIWFRSYAMKNDTRLSYKLAPDVPRVEASAREQRVAILATAQRDPANPEFWAPDGLSDKYNTLSVLELEQAPSDELLYGDTELPVIQRHRLYSPRMGNKRNVDIIVPSALKTESGQVVPLAIFFDGKEYQSRIPVPRIMDNLIRSGKIPATVAVLISNPSHAARRTELPCNPDFADFMAQELLPFVAEKTGLSFSASSTLLAGASYGGLASACTAYRYPEKFGLVLSQSGSFWWNPKDSDRPEWLNTQFASEPKKSLRFYLSAGRFETNFGESGILSSNRQLELILKTKGYPVQLEEFSAGHDYFHWRATLDRGLVHLLGAK